VSVGDLDEEVRDECVQYGKMIGKLVFRISVAHYFDVNYTNYDDRG